MNRRLIECGLAACGVLLLCPGISLAQRYATINRASDQAASANLGRVGGFYTGRYGAAYSISPNSPQNLGNVGNGLTRPNYFGAGWQMGSLPAPAVPQAFSFGSPGAKIPVTVSPWASALAGVQSAELAYASGMTSETSYDAPYTSRQPVGFSIPNTPYFAPQRSSSALRNFFNVATAVPKEPPPQTAPELNWIQLLQLDNQNELAAKKELALLRFKRATATPLLGNEERLAEVQQALQAVKDLDPQESLTCLLLVHLALERNQLVLAAVNLQDAVTRDPEVFMKYRNLGQYFGDPELMRVKAREIIRFGDVNSDPVNYILQAYGAWLLDDNLRLGDTLKLMGSEAIDSQMTPKAKAVQYALSAAIQ